MPHHRLRVDVGVRPTEYWDTVQGFRSSILLLSRMRSALTDLSRLQINPGCDKCVHDVQEAAVKNLKRQIDEFDSVPVVIGGIPRPDGMNGGLSATCLTCRNEETATPGFPMSQCGKCKLVRCVCKFFLHAWFPIDGETRRYCR